MLHHDKHRQLHKALAQANSYAEWLAIAEELDTAEGLMAWRASDASQFCHDQLMRDHIRQMQNFRQSNDLHGLIGLLQESIYRHNGELNNPELYQYARSGTKFIVTEYLDEIERVMWTLCEQTIPDISERRKLELFEQAAKIYGRPALILSGGAAFGIYHLGVVKALWELNLLPDVLAGSSMGSIIASAICSKNDIELDLFFKEQLDTVHLDALHWRSLRDMRKQGSMMDEQQLLSHIQTNIGNMTFAEAYQHSGRILNITISPTRTYQKPRLLNYLTAPDVLIEYAALASCAVPFLFPPVALQARARDGRQVPYMSTEKWIDGALHGDVPRERLARLLNISQTIVSQANPHVIPFITHKNQRGARAFGKQVAATVIHEGSAELLDISRQLTDKTPFHQIFSQAYAIASQQYLGDINLHFPFKPREYLKVISNPTPQRLKEYIRMGERATWPRVAMIRDMTRISRLFPECIEVIKKRIGNGVSSME